MQHDDIKLSILKQGAECCCVECHIFCVILKVIIMNVIKLNVVAPLQVYIMLIGLNHPLDGVTNSKYKLLHFLTTKKFLAKRRRD